MTDEELDLLASSFLDGEATPEEVAIIERDPALTARVEELRIAQTAVRAPVPDPSMHLKEEQLAAALAAFDVSDRRTTLMAVDQASGTAPTAPQAAGSVDAERPDTGPIIDLGSRRQQREEREAAAAGRLRWLSAVAGVVVFTAGAVFLVGQVNGDGDDAEFAGDVVSEETEAASTAEAEPASSDGEAASDSANADFDADTLADDGADEAIGSQAMGSPDAEEDFAEEAEEAADEEAADDSADAASAADADAGPTIREDLPEEGFFGDEPVVSYTTVPTSDELLAQLDLPWRNPGSANCAAGADLPDGAEVIAYLPIEIPGTDAGADSGATQVVEALYLTVGNESQVILVDPGSCQAI